MKRTTTPLAKSYVTLEGWVTILANIVLVATPIVTTSLSATQAAKYGAIINGAFILSRAIVKASAAKQPVEILTPGTPSPEAMAIAKQRFAEQSVTTSGVQASTTGQASWNVPHQGLSTPPKALQPDDLEAGPADEDVMEPEELDPATWQAAREAVPEEPAA